MTAAFDLREPVLAIQSSNAKFPGKRYAHASLYCDAYFEEVARAASSIDTREVDRAAEVLIEAYTRGATVFSCGNGGSASISNHLQCDHLKGVRTQTDLSPKVHSLSTNVELVTAIANDIGYEDIFSYQLQSQSRPGDVLVAISSSGRSSNIVGALTWARENGLSTIALSGFEGGDAKKVADVAIHVDSKNYGIVEDLHQAVMHTLAQYLRQSRMADHVVPLTTF